MDSRGSISNGPEGARTVFQPTVSTGGCWIAWRTASTSLTWTAGIRGVIVFP
jgi:hypothetical protein